MHALLLLCGFLAGAGHADALGSFLAKGRLLSAHGLAPEAPGAEGQGPIPLVVHVTSFAPALAGELGRLWQGNLARFPNGTRLSYYNDEDMARSVCRIAPALSAAGVVDGAHEAFASLRPVAFKADLWRYMVLWAEGGFYFDHKLQVQADVTDWINVSAPGRLWVVKDMQPGLYNAIIAAPPRHPLLAKVLKHVVGVVLAQGYPEPGPRGGDATLAITGPVAFGVALGMRGSGGLGNWTFEGFQASASGDTPVVFAELGRNPSGGGDLAVVSLARSSPRQVFCTISESLHKLPAGSIWYGTYVHWHSVYDTGKPQPCLPP